MQGFPADLPRAAWASYGCSTDEKDSFSSRFTDLSL